MRVLLDATVLRLRPGGGTAVYVERLAAALREEGVDVVEAVDVRRRPSGTGSVRNALEDLRWTQAALRRRAAAIRADVVHHPLPAVTWAASRPQVVTVHDLAFEALPGAFGPRFRAYARVAHRAAAQRAAVVVCPSAATARDVRDRWGVDALVAAHGPGQELPVLSRARRSRHLLYVGDGEPRKDLPTLLEAYARYRRSAAAALPLVLAGSARAAADGVRVVERPGRAQLAELLAAAAALVHPSRHEGFGLTVLEALRAGTPVIAADTPAVRELLGPATTARLVPPGDPAALAAALLAPPPEPDPQRSAAFSWRRSARRHIEAYRLALR